MGKRYLIDSNAVVDFLTGILPDKGKKLILKISPEISVISSIEILSKKNLTEAEIQRFEAFIKASIVYSEIDESIARQAISIRKKHGIKIPDAIIAATAIVNGLILITRNEKDFIHIHKLMVVNPWKI
jgi:predicted nucleic acid-binding protein